MSEFETFLFVHVPKAAGTSFRLAVEGLFPERVVYDYGARNEDTSELIREHVYAKPDLLALRDALVEAQIAMLGGHIHYQHYAEIFPPDRVLTIVREPIGRVISEFHHMQRHYGFSGTLLEFAGRPRERDKQTRVLRGGELSEFAFVGIMERYHESLRMLKDRLGWTVPYLMTNVNPTRTDSARRRRRLPLPAPGPRSVRISWPRPHDRSGHW